MYSIPASGECVTTGGERAECTGWRRADVGGEEHNMINATGGEEHNVTEEQNVPVAKSRI